MKKTFTKQEMIDFENGICDLYMDNKLPFLFHLSGGNEDQLIKIFENIDENDYVISNHRSHYHALLHGIPPETIRDRILNGRSMFMYDRSRNFFCSAIIGGTPAIAAGIAMALKRKGSKQKVWCFIGDATEDSGHTYEAVRYVEGFDLPCTFIIENNNRSVEATNVERWGKAAECDWGDTEHVIKYHYNIPYPHARKDGMIDLSKCVRKTDEEYFPHVHKLVQKDFSDLGDPNISYKDAMNKCMDDLGKQGALFIGYNVARGNAMGSLKTVPNEQKIETPVAENLMCGLAIGAAIEGFIPVLYFERHDFMLVAADAIGNHIDKIERISHGEFKVPIIIRAVTADAGPFYSGPTHQQDFTELFRKLVSFPVLDPANGYEVLEAYETFKSLSGPIMIVDRKSKY